MTKRNEVYKCPMCGNIIEVLHAGAGALVCCGQPMELQAENTVDASKEKHVPVVEKTADGYKVTVGSVAHPMEEKHWIEWIELIVGTMIYRQHLKPGDKPEACFCCCSGSSCGCQSAAVSARAYCNLHGNWKS